MPRRLLQLLLLCCSMACALARPPPPGLDATLQARMEALPERDGAAREALIRTALAAQTEPAVRLWLLEQLSQALAWQRRWEPSLEAAREGQRLATAPQDQAQFAVRAGTALLETKRSAEALSTYEQVAPLLATLEAAPDGRSLVASVRQMGGAALSQLHRLPEAMDLLTLALRSHDAAQDGAGQAEVLNEIAMVHFRSERMEEAIRTQQRAIEAAESSTKPTRRARYFLRLSHYQSQLGQAEAQQQALLQAETLARAEGDDYNLAVVATNLADVALQRQDYAMALRYAEVATPLVERSGDEVSLAVCWINRGIALNRLRRSGGIAWIERGAQAFEAMPTHQVDAAAVYLELAKEHAFNGDWERAYRAQLRFKALDDKVRKATDMKRLAEADAAYQADKKQRQIEALQREQRVSERLRLLWVLIGVLGAGMALVLLWSRRTLRKAYSAMQDMALLDPLTGLKNRRDLALRIDDDLAQLRRQQHPGAHQRAAVNVDLAFVMIDMDHFKAVNDTHGHAAGDAVLVQMAGILRECTRESDRVVRWGGEEFLVLARPTDRAEVHQLVERIRSRVEAHVFDIGGGQTLRKTCSIGFACYPQTPPGQPWAHWENVVSLADQCLYLVKASGRNGWVGALPEDERELTQWDLAEAVKRGQLRLVQSPGLTLQWP